MKRISKPTKPLTLQRETIKNLSALHLADAHGGAVDWTRVVRSLKTGEHVKC